MKQKSLFIKSLILGILITVVYHPAYARLYRWTDENGKTFFSDKVPPTQKHLKREKLNKIGLVIEEVKAVEKVKAKTKEELIAEEQELLLKQQQQQQLEQQKQKDKFLLSTFDTFESLQNSHQGKLKSLDEKIIKLNTNLVNLEETFSKQTKKFNDNKEQNKTTSKKDLKSMETLDKKIKLIHLDIEKSLKNKIEIVKKQASETKRYLFLMDSRSKN